MKFRLLLVLTLCSTFFLPTGTPSASTSFPLLDQVASKFSEHQVKVFCYTEGEQDDSLHFDPAIIGAWGFVWRSVSDEVNLDYVPCDGALAISQGRSGISGYGTAPLWQEALGTLVLTHESYHLRLSYGLQRFDEAQTECRAIRHFGYAVRALGGSSELVEQLRPYALSLHYELASKYPAYNLKSCKIQWYWGG